MGGEKQKISIPDRLETVVGKKTKQKPRNRWKNVCSGPTWSRKHKGTNLEIKQMSSEVNSSQLKTKQKQKTNKQKKRIKLLFRVSTTRGHQTRRGPAPTHKKSRIYCSYLSQPHRLYITVTPAAEATTTCNLRRPRTRQTRRTGP